MIRRLLDASEWIALLLVAVSILLHVGPRDAWPFVDIVYYLLQPTPLLMGLLFVTIVSLRRRAKRPLRWVMIAVSLAVAGWWGIDSFAWPRPVESPPRFRVVLWNVAYQRWPESMAKQITALDPDVIALVELRNEDGKERWSECLPGYSHVAGDGELAVWSRTPVTDLGKASLPGRARLRVLQLLIDAQVLPLLLVDVKSDPRNHRREPLEWVAEQAAVHDAALILGDFNTPSVSRHFAPLRSRWEAAFEAAGVGYRPTWPTPLPVWDLDQVWLDPARLTVGQAYSEWTWHSDHRPVVVDLRLGSQ